MINFRAASHILAHAGWRNNIVQRQRGILLQIRVMEAGAGEFLPRCPFPTNGVDLPDLLDHLKKAGTTGNTIAFQRRGHRQTDGLLRPFRICHHQIGGQGV